jgi:CDP-paratose 2-epimerase
MKLLITGVCGFVGSRLASWFRQHDSALEIIGIDNFVRPGSETNRPALKALGVIVRHGDVRNASDLENLPKVDWVIDAAANPSVLAGADGRSSSRQVVEHNLHGTLNVLEYCKGAQAGLVLLSTSRVYSIPALNSLPLKSGALAFEWEEKAAKVEGASREGLDVSFSTAAPVSLYGSTKLASELLALEYGETFSLPVWIDRCGVMAGAGQFGTAEQGIFSYWIHAYAQKRPLKYIGFEGSGRQVRDVLHPDDLAELVALQIKDSKKGGPRIFNAGGGAENAMSLRELTNWCAERFGKHVVRTDTGSRPFDVPWVVMDNRRVSDRFKWAPQRNIKSILEEIAEHAERNPGWLELTAPE